MRHNELKSKQRRLREGFPQDLSLRVHRAISWIGRAEKETQDHDAAFVFLWIAFNAAYADERDVDSVRSLGDRRQFVDLIDRLVAHDEEGRPYGVVWDRFRGPISKLMENRFVYRPYWLNQNDIARNEGWARRFRASADRFVRAMADRDTAYVLRQVFDRLFMLRCQKMHGRATRNGKVNRQLVRDAADIRHRTRKQHSAEEKIRIVLEGLRGEWPSDFGDGFELTVLSSGRLRRTSASTL